MTQQEIEKRWMESLLKVEYRFSDAVRMKCGERAGETGRIVALFSLVPAPHYVIEFPDGTSETAFENDLERAS